MSWRDEIKQFMVISETLLDASVQVEELNTLELGVVQHYLLEVGKEFKARPRPRRRLKGQTCTSEPNKREGTSS